ncbi:MAG: hypothetical protein J6Z47_05025 [Bacteroidales bacterium]|nr:hypothetical protein [Bacteroidales bacterium]
MTFFEFLGGKQKSEIIESRKPTIGIDMAKKKSSEGQCPAAAAIKIIKSTMKEHKEATMPTIIFTLLRRFQIKIAKRIRITPTAPRSKSTPFVRFPKSIHLVSITVK